MNETYVISLMIGSLVTALVIGLGIWFNKQNRAHWNQGGERMLMGFAVVFIVAVGALAMYDWVRMTNNQSCNLFHYLLSFFNRMLAWRAFYFSGSMSNVGVGSFGSPP